MKKIYHGLMLVTAVLLTYCTSSSIVNIPNLGEAKKLVQNYYESGEFDRECSKIIDEAILTIDGMNVTENSTVIFDVDETALSNYTYTKAIGFGYSDKSWNDWQQKGIAPTIQQTKRLYDYLISKKIHVIFLTGRDNEFKDATHKNLIEKGYIKFDTLIVRATNENKIPAAKFKAIKREELVKNGYDIIANAGDQESDFIGGNTGIKIKLPNYLYIIE